MEHSVTNGGGWPENLAMLDYLSLKTFKSQHKERNLFSASNKNTRSHSRDMPSDMPRELFYSFLHFIQRFVEESFQDLRTAQFAFSVRNLAKVLSSTGTAEDLGCAGQGWLFFAFLLPFSLWTMDRVFKVRYSNLRMYNIRSKVKPLLKTHVIFFNFKRPVRLWLPCLSNLLFDCSSLNRSKAVSWTGDGSNRRGPLPVQNVKSRVHRKVFFHPSQGYDMFILSAPWVNSAYLHPSLFHWSLLFTVFIASNNPFSKNSVLPEKEKGRCNFMIES